MEGLFIYVFVLIVAVVALLKWNLSNLEKIKELEESNKELLNAKYKFLNKKNGQ